MIAKRPPQTLTGVVVLARIIAEWDSRPFDDVRSLNHYGHARERCIAVLVRIIASLRLTAVASRAGRPRHDQRCFVRGGSLS